MLFDQFEYQQFDHVHGYGYPLILSTVTCHASGANVKLEIFTLPINYNRGISESDLRRRLIDVTQLYRSKYETKQILQFGIETGVSELTGRISAEGQSLAQQHLPLKQRPLSLDALLHLQTAPAFDTVKEYLGNNTVSDALKKKLVGMMKMV